METPAEAPAGGSRHWWLKMLGWSAALALSLLAVAGAARPLYLRYRAWRYPPEYKMVIYDVQDLVMPVPDFSDPAPPPDPPGLHSSPCSAWPQLTAADLTKAIRELAGSDAWPEDKTRLEERNGKLVIVQTPEVHREVRALLDGERYQYKRAIDLEVVFAEGAGLRRLLDEAGVRSGALLDSDPAGRLVDALRKQGARLVRPDSACYLGLWLPKKAEDPVVRCFNHGVLRLTATKPVEARLAGRGAREKVTAGFALEVYPSLAPRGEGFVLRLHPSYCAVLPEGAGSTEAPAALDQRELWTSVTMPGAGWTALLLEPGRSAGGRDGTLEPVLVLVGARPAKPEPPERVLKL